jgi:carbon monoxide dehydrogenase subunit G
MRLPGLTVHGGVDAEVHVTAPPKAVAALLADPGSAQSWFPIDVEIDESGPRRWRAGSRFAVLVGLKGEQVRFAVEVASLNARGLEFRADGAALVLNGKARFQAHDRGTRFHARVDVSGHGLTGEVLGTTALGLLHGGALDRALHVVKREVEAAA